MKRLILAGLLVCVAGCPAGNSDRLEVTPELLLVCDGFLSYMQIEQTLTAVEADRLNGWSYMDERAMSDTLCGFNDVCIACNHAVVDQVYGR